MRLASASGPTLPDPSHDSIELQNIDWSLRYGVKRAMIGRGVVLATRGCENSECPTIADSSKPPHLPSSSHDFGTLVVSGTTTFGSA
jgi:hypothetical protein